MSNTRGLECIMDNLKKHPHCPHGPMLLFGAYINGELKKFYSCSVCRDKKLCKFYLNYGQELSKHQQRIKEKEIKQLKQRYHHRKLYIHFNNIKAESPARRCYCHYCEKLFLSSEKNEHSNHEITENLTDYQLHHPTEFLKSLGNAKKEAQYLFSKKTTEDIINMLLRLKAKQVLCIGTPRIYEYISEYHTDKMSPLLLDFDGRFHNFFGPLNYCWYNLFNHHFFNEDAVNVFKDFITQNEGEDTYLICDPPFGGRVEAMSHTIRMISDLHKKLNNNDNISLKVMFIFPYFMETIMKEKSNLPSVAGGLKDLEMSDYKVTYDHPLFASSKQGSPVRIFTNIPLKLLELPELDGYKFCKKCEKWVSSENKHCKMCKKCTSKDGRTYRHCNICKRCVKPIWKHCKICNKCILEKHICGKVPTIVGRCFKCDKLGHTAKQCPSESSIETITTETDTEGCEAVEKRKADNELSDSELKVPLTKKRRIKDSKTSHEKLVNKKKVSR